MKHNHNADGRPKGSEERATHRSLERGLHVIETVVATAGGASLAETARRIGLHRSTTHHLLQALVGMGYLNQDPRTRRYHPSTQLARLSGPASEASNLDQIAHPFLADLARRCDEAVSLTVYREGVATVIARRDPNNAPRTAPDDDAPLPLHATASGKIILAWRPEAERAAMVNQLTLERLTANTIDNRAVIEAELRRIRNAGFAVDDEEYQTGIRAIAAPILDRTGQGVAALCVVGPKVRMTRQKIKALRDPLGELARLLSEQLGWRPAKAN